MDRWNEVGPTNPLAIGHGHHSSKSLHLVDHPKSDVEYVPNWHLFGGLVVQLIAGIELWGCVALGFADIQCQAAVDTKSPKVLFAPILFLDGSNCYDLASY